MGRKPDDYQKIESNTFIVHGTQCATLEIVTTTLESLMCSDQLTKIHGPKLRKALVKYPAHLIISLANYGNSDGLDLEDRLPSDCVELAN